MGHESIPDVAPEEQEAKLWDAIFKATRADLENPVEAWKEHDETLHTKVDYLNESIIKLFTIQVMEQI